MRSKGTWKRHSSGASASSFPQYPSAPRPAPRPPAAPGPPQAAAASPVPAAGAAQRPADLLDAPHEADGLPDVLRQLPGGDARPRHLVDVTHGRRRFPLPAFRRGGRAGRDRRGGAGLPLRPRPPGSGGGGR